VVTLLRWLGPHPAGEQRGTGLHRDPRAARCAGASAYRRAGCASTAARSCRRSDGAASQRQRSGKPVPVEPADDPRLHHVARTRIFVGVALPGHSNRLSRLVKTPKLHLGDTGVACALLGLDAESLNRDRSMLGQLLETFVLQELRRQASWNEASITFHHFRDRDGAEVDIVLERGAHEVAGIEVKAAATVTASDFRVYGNSSRPPVNVSLPE